MNERQCTLAKTVDIEGVGLFFGQPVHLRCLPAEANAGVVFVRTDLPGAPRIPAKLENVPGPNRWTGLRKDEAEVSMIEHLLAALYGLGIQNLIVETNATEMPIGDGSAQTYVQPFLEAGIKELDASWPRLDLPHPIAVTDREVIIAAVPQGNGLSITYVLDYGGSFLGTQVLTLNINRDTFIREIAPARTYVLRPEVDAFIQQNLGKGATPENTIVLEENGTTSEPLRFPDECIRHKILDLIGDLYLAGGRIAGRIIGYKSGHTINIRLAAAIREAIAKQPVHAVT